MKLNNLLRIQSGIAAALISGLLLGTPAFGQNEVDEELETFTVTGSRIPRLDIIGVNPVLQITREDIDLGGYADLQGLMRDLPQNRMGLNDEAVFGFTPGASGTNLRGAGLQYTLTLINGRRAAPYGRGAGGTIGFVNTSAIPLSAIESVEILTDGASAIYGADAIAGVQNIILRKDFEGLEVGTTYQNTFDSDTGYFNVNAVSGFVTPKGNAIIVVDYSTRNALYRRDRDWSATSDQSFRGGLDWPTVGFGFPPYGDPTIIRNEAGNYFITSKAPYSTEELINNRNIDGLSFKDMKEAFGDAVTEPNTDASLTPEWERLFLMASFNYELTDAVNFYFEGSYSRNDTFNSVHPVAMDTEREDLIISPDNPYNPFGVNRTDGLPAEEVVAFYRVREIGQRTAELLTTATRIVAGVEGKIADNLTWSLDGMYMVDGGVAMNGGGTLRSAANDALSSDDPLTAWNIFGAFSGGPTNDNNSEIIPGLRAFAFNEFEAETLMATATVGGSLFEIPAGEVNFATGLEQREEQYYDRSDAASSNGDLVGRGGGNPSSGARSASSAYVEFQVPVLDNLEAQIAARYEKFDGDIGDNFSPKVGLAYRPLSWLLLRGSYSEGFRAPSLQELFDGESVAFASAGIDPLRNGEALNSTRVRRGGNPFLNPEESESFYLGVVFEPTSGVLDGLTVSVDWSRIEIENVIASDSLQQIVNSNDFRVVRAPLTPADQAAGFTGGRVIELLNFTRNKAFQKLEALDFAIDYRLLTETMGAFRFGLNGTYMYSRKTKNDASSAWVENAGTPSEPEWVLSATQRWHQNDITVFSAIKYMGAYEQWYGTASWAKGPPFNLTSEEVSAWVTWDLGITYRLPWDAEITAQIINVFDKEPHMYDRDPEGYDPLTHNPFGRMYRLSVKKSF